MENCQAINIVITVNKNTLPCWLVLGMSVNMCVVPVAAVLVNGVGGGGGWVGLDETSLTSLNMLFL